jgi:DNA-binding NarL/FixJ family response regulator
LCSNLTGSSPEAATNLRESIRVLIADDHRLFAQALEAILVTDERLEIAGHARDGAEAVELARSLDPDVILMDIAMPGMDGFEATRQIRRHKADACVLMLTGSNSRTDVDRAREAGAAGYVTKDRIAAELIDAIVEVSEK